MEIRVRSYFEVVENTVSEPKRILNAIAIIGGCVVIYNRGRRRHEAVMRRLIDESITVEDAISRDDKQPCVRP